MLKTVLNLRFAAGSIVSIVSKIKQDMNKMSSSEERFLTEFNLKSNSYNVEERIQTLLEIKKVLDSAEDSIDGILSKKVTNVEKSEDILASLKVTNRLLKNVSLNSKLTEEDVQIFINKNRNLYIPAIASLG